MILLPISEYPTSSDPKARMQALGERKSEITEAQQNVNDSSLSEDKKNAINNKLENQKKSINVKINRAQSQDIYNKKLESKRLETKRVNKEALETQSQNTHKLDKRV